MAPPMIGTRLAQYTANSRHPEPFQIAFIFGFERDADRNFRVEEATIDP
jgi:hypothetical protein